MPADQFKLDYSNAARIATVRVSHELSAPSEKRLADALRRLSGFMGGRKGLTEVRFELAIPLSRQFAAFASNQCQLLELPGVISIPPLAAAEQRALSHELAAVNNPSVRIEVRAI